MTPHARPLFAVGMAVLALGAAGVVLLSSHGSPKPTVDLHIVGATATTLAPATIDPPTSQTMETTPAPAVSTTVSLPPKARQVPQQAAKAQVIHTHTFTTSTTATTSPPLPPGVKLIPPIQCRPNLGCGPPR